MTKEASPNHINKRFPHHELHAIIFINYGRKDIRYEAGGKTMESDVPQG